MQTHIIGARLIVGGYSKNPHLLLVNSGFSRLAALAT